MDGYQERLYKTAEIAGNKVDRKAAERRQQTTDDIAAALDQWVNFTQRRFG